MRRKNMDMDNVAGGNGPVPDASAADVVPAGKDLSVALDFCRTDVTDMAQVKKAIAMAKKDKGGRAAPVTKKGGRAANATASGDGVVNMQEYTMPDGRRVVRRAKKRTSAKEKREAAVIKHAEKAQKILPGKKSERVKNVNETIMEVTEAIPDSRIPFVMATLMNRRDGITRYRDGIVSSTLEFLHDHMATFRNDFKRLEDKPELRMRLFIEMARLVIARPKELLEMETGETSRAAIISRMFGFKTEI